MQSAFEGRAEYLSLALFAQEIVERLKNFAIDADSTTLVPALEQARKTLSDVKSGEAKRFGRRDAAALSSYQQLSALAKAWPAQELDLVLRLIGDVIADPKNRKLDVDQLANLFLKLQAQALWSFERPESPPTEELRQLCQTAP